MFREVMIDMKTYKAPYLADWMTCPSNRSRFTKIEPFEVWTQPAHALIATAKSCSTTSSWNDNFEIDAYTAEAFKNFPKS